MLAARVIIVKGHFIRNDRFALDVHASRGWVNPKVVLQISKMAKIGLSRTRSSNHPEKVIDKTREGLSIPSPHLFHLAFPDLGMAFSNKEGLDHWGRMISVLRFRARPARVSLPATG
jgi:hypothetical protein